jgi:hypothetical protein
MDRRTNKKNASPLNYTPYKFTKFLRNAKRVCDLKRKITPKYRLGGILKAKTSRI